MRRNLRWLDLAASAPENICVRNRDIPGLQMPIHGGLMIEEQLLIRAMRHSHDIDVPEFGAGFAPVAVG